MIEWLLPLAGQVLPEVLGPGGALGGEAGGKVQVSTTVEQSNVQQTGVTFNPLITVSSPSSHIKPVSESSFDPVAKVSQAAPVSQDAWDQPFLPGQPLESSTSAGLLPAGSGGGGLLSGESSDILGMIGDNWLLVGAALLAAGYFLMVK